MDLITHEKATSRPRVIGWVRSAALLDGDWGTSIAYVLGIGFALAGYSSFWHLFLMLGLTALVAVNYITICRLFPNGGGVYSSVYHRSKTFAVIGALLLVADYVVTISLSVLEACHYFGLQHESAWAIAIILVIGVLNWFGPKNTGTFAIVISLATMATFITIITASAPQALTNADLVLPSGGFEHNWAIFAGIILSISGIEAISNMTGLMKDPTRDSRIAILAVLGKVIFVTVFLGLAMHAVPQLSGHTEDMVRFLGEHYVGAWFGWVVAMSLGMLLISAGNTALNDLISIQYLMAADRELPASLQLLNQHGVPYIPLAIATLVPVVVLILVRDVLTLAQLYAIGVVGAILINVGSNATDSTLKISRSTRIMMFISAAILFFVELSIGVEKPKASLFAAVVLLTGLAARTIVYKKRQSYVEIPQTQTGYLAYQSKRKKRPQKFYLVAVTGKYEQVLHFAIEESRLHKAALIILRVKEIAVGALPDKIEVKSGSYEKRIHEICEQAGIHYQFIVVPSYEVGYTIAEQAALFGVERVIVGATQRNLLHIAFKGSVIRTVNNLLPADIQLVIFRG